MASKAGDKGRKRKQYLPYNKAVKKKGAYPICPGVKGFFITCDGGREFQASQEAINVIDSFFEEIIEGKDPSSNLSEKPVKPQNKKIKFSYSESSSSDDDNDEEEEKEGKDNVCDDASANKEDSTNEKPAAQVQEEAVNGNQTDEKSAAQEQEDAVNGNQNDEKPAAQEQEETVNGNQTKEKTESVEESENQASEEPPEKKQCLETDAPKSVAPEKVEEESVDKLIEAELRELGDKSKRRFSKLDSGCNGVVFVQMRKRDGDPSPKDIVQHMMTSAAKTRKHMSRFILRVLPIEVSCYASEEEITRAIKPLVAEHFPAETENPQKYAVLYEARANTGIDRMKIIDAVAKCIPAPHKVDLKNPDKNIVVQIVRTVCLIGVVEKYKELSKYNLRQLTSS